MVLMPVIYILVNVTFSLTVHAAARVLWMHSNPGPCFIVVEGVDVQVQGVNLGGKVCWKPCSNVVPTTSSLSQWVMCLQGTTEHRERPTGVVNTMGVNMAEQQSLLQAEHRYCFHLDADKFSHLCTCRVVRVLVEGAMFTCVPSVWHTPVDSTELHSTVQNSLEYSLPGVHMAVS